MFPMFKNISEYTPENREKRKGTKSGLFVHRMDPEKSKTSSWLIKVGGGYNRIDSGNFSSGALSDSHVIRESYSGNIYKIFIPDNVTKTRIFYNNNRNQESEPEFLLGSKLIENFEDLEDINRDVFTALTVAERKKISKDIAKVRIVSAMLNEGDLENKLANSGFQRRDGQLIFKKIDHGESLDLNVQGSSFSQEFSFPNEYGHLGIFLHQLNLNVDSTLFWEAIDEIVSADITALDNIIAFHEHLLSQSRERHGVFSHYMVSDEPDKIGQIIRDRFECLTRLNNLKKNIDQRIIESTEQLPEADVSSYRSLLTELRHITVIDHPHIESISYRFNQILNNELDENVRGVVHYRGPY